MYVLCPSSIANIFFLPLLTILSNSSVVVVNMYRLLLSAQGYHHTYMTSLNPPNLWLTILHRESTLQLTKYLNILSQDFSSHKSGATPLPFYSMTRWPYLSSTLKLVWNEFLKEKLFVSLLGIQLKLLSFKKIQKVKYIQY